MHVLYSTEQYIYSVQPLKNTMIEMSEISKDINWTSAMILTFYLFIFYFCLGNKSVELVDMASFERFHEKY